MTKNVNKARSASTKPIGTINPNASGQRAEAPKDTPLSAKPPSKTDQIIALLSSPNGATLDELVAATAWLPHTTRAALTGLKKKGRTLSSEKFAGVRRYWVGKPS